MIRTISKHMAKCLEKRNNKRAMSIFQKLCTICMSRTEKVTFDINTDINTDINRESTVTYPMEIMERINVF